MMKHLLAHRILTNEKTQILVWWHSSWNIWAPTIGMGRSFYT